MYVKCKFCPKWIYLSRHPSTGKYHPISIETHAASRAPTRNTWGQGVTHYADCPGAERARQLARIQKVRAERPTKKQLLTCIHCGCDDDHACAGGCHWISRNPPICSECAFFDEPMLPGLV